VAPGARVAGVVLSTHAALRARWCSFPAPAWLSANGLGRGMPPHRAGI